MVVGGWIALLALCGSFAAISPSIWLVVPPILGTTTLLLYGHAKTTDSRAVLIMGGATGITLIAVFGWVLLGARDGSTKTEPESSALSSKEVPPTSPPQAPQAANATTHETESTAPTRITLTGEDQGSPQGLSLIGPPVARARERNWYFGFPEPASASVTYVYGPTANPCQASRSGSSPMGQASVFSTSG